MPVGDRSSLTRRRTTWPGRQPADHPLREGGMLGVQLPPGPLTLALADQPGVVATPSPWRAWVQIPSRVLTRRVGWAPASPSGCNPPAFAVQVQLLPDTLTGLVAQPAEQDSLKVEVQGSTPCGATGRLMGVSSNGKTVGLHPADEGSTPSTVHWKWPGGGKADTRSSEGRAHRGVRVQVPPWSLAVVTLVVKRTSRDSPKVEAQVRLLAGVPLLRW
jgi:hypothetical protein